MQPTYNPVLTRWSSLVAAECRLMQVGTGERAIRRPKVPRASNDAMRRSPNRLRVSVELDEGVEVDEVWKDLSTGSTKVQQTLKDQVPGE